MGLKAAGQWGPKGREGARMLLWSLVLFFPNSDPLRGGVPEDRESSQGRPLVGKQMYSQTGGGVGLGGKSRGQPRLQ